MDTINKSNSPVLPERQAFILVDIGVGGGGVRIAG
jgi:hypothetical protein